MAGAERREEAWLRRLWSRAVFAFDDPEKIRRQNYQFLPAAIEIQETPPSPVGRSLVWSIMSFFTIAVAWSWVGKVDIVAVAPGKIIPSGRVKVIQPLEIGTVESIHVEDGQSVRQGQPLITLDSTQTEADATLVAIQLMDAQLDELRLTRLQELLSQPDAIDASGSDFRPAVDSPYATPEKIAHQQRLLSEQLGEYRARDKVVRSEVEQREAELKRIEATLEKLERTLPIITERADSSRRLLETEMLSRAKYLEVEKERIETEQDLVATRAQLDETRAALETARAESMSLAAEYRRQNLTELTRTQHLIPGYQQELIKAQQREDRQILYAPNDGTVQQLAVHTVGAVVTPAQELMLIVPEDSALEVEAFVLNKDIGFVEDGQAAEVKIDTFNFTQYGTIHGEVLDISDDAIQDEDRGLVYRAKVQLADTRIQVGKRAVNLSPGMAVTVEVKTGKRRLIEFFLSPLLRYKDESVRER